VRDFLIYFSLNINKAKKGIGRPRFLPYGKKDTKSYFYFLVWARVRHALLGWFRILPWLVKLFRCCWFFAFSNLEELG
jgi:hypothetical protein